MHHLSSKKAELVIKLDIEELTPVQVRLLKSVNALFTNLLTAEDEAEYFEASAVLMKKTAELIKSSSFPQNHKNMDYATQAVEFAVDYLNEEVEGQATLDN